MISYILYYTIVSVCTRICDGASVSDLEITYNYGAETNNWNNYRCGDMIWINENKTMDLILKSNTKLFVAWCDDGEHQMQLEISKKNVNYHNHNLAPEHLAYTKLYGNDVYEGEWNCTLLTKKGVPVDHLADKRNVYKHTDGENYLAIWCTISIAVRRSIKLWVYNDGEDLTDSMLLQSGGPSDTTYVYFRQGQHFVIKCQKDFEGDILKSGTLRNNICIESEQCRISEQKNKSILQYISKNHNSYGKNIINSSCIYNSAKNVKTTSVVNFILINDKPPELSVVDDKVYIYNGVYYYEGKSGNAITIRCANKETSGSLNSTLNECPEDKSGVCISSSLANKNVINKNITLTDGTKYKWECVYINPFKAETKSVMIITVIRPPKITVNSSSQGLQTTTDMLGWRGMKENITIKCINQEKKGSIAWQYGNETDNNSKSPITTTLERTMEINNCNSNTLINCVYTSEFGKEFKSSVLFIISEEKSLPTPSNQEIRTTEHNRVPKVINHQTKDDCGVCEHFCEDNSQANLFLNITLWYPNVEKHTGYQCGQEIIIDSNEHLVMKIESLRRYVYKQKCFTRDGRQMKLTSGNTPVNILRIGHYFEISITAKNLGTWDCSFLTLKNFGNTYTPDVCHDNDMLLYKRLDCILTVTPKVTDPVTTVYPPSIPGDATHGNSTNSTEGPIYSQHDSGMKEKPEDNTNTILIYGLLAGGILIIAILILAMVRTCRKPADDQKRSSGHYENFTNERSPIQPFPGRANLEETYICPADCQEPTYAVSKNPGSTDTYAEPYKPKLEDLYSKPTPKKDRNNVNDLYSQITPKRKETADEVNYAEIDNKTVKGDSNIRGKNDKPVIYAEVSKYANLAQEVLDAKKKMDQKDEYSNVFTNERYCNSRNKSDDYAEPSYCEVNRK